MTGRSGRSLLGLVLAAALPATACTSSSGHADAGRVPVSNRPPAASAQPSQAAVTYRTLPPVAVAALDRSSDEVLTVRSATRVAVDRGDGTRTRETVLQFALPDACVVSAELQLGRPSSATDAAGLSVYPSAFPKSTRTASSTPSVVAGPTLLDNRPRAAVQVGAVATADVTEAVRLWQAGGPFPSEGTTVEKGSPVALDVLWSDLTRPVHVGFGDRPMLRLGTRLGSCPAASS